MRTVTHDDEASWKVNHPSFCPVYTVIMSSCVYQIECLDVIKRRSAAAAAAVPNLTPHRVRCTNPSLYAPPSLCLCLCICLATVAWHAAALAFSPSCGVTRCTRAEGRGAARLRTAEMACRVAGAAEIRTLDFVCIFGERVGGFKSGCLRLSPYFHQSMPRLLFILA